MQRSARDWLGLASFDNGAPADEDGYLSQDLGEGQDDDEIPSGQFAAGNGIHIAIVRPRNFRDAATVGDYYRQEIPVIINLEDMEKADATRIIDFISGLILGLGGDLEKISRRTFLIVPADAAIITTHDGLTQEGFFNQALPYGADQSGDALPHGTDREALTPVTAPSRQQTRKTPTPPKTKAPNTCLGRTAARTPQTAKTAPPAAVMGAAALLAVSKAASLRIVDGVRTPTAESRATRPCHIRTASHKTMTPASTSTIAGMSIAATSTSLLQMRE